MENLILDVDGVIVDLINPLLDIYNYKYKTDFVIDDITDYDLTKTLTKFDISLLNNYSLYKNLPFIDDDIPEYITKLKERYNIYFVTALPLVCDLAVQGRIEFFKNNLYEQSECLSNLIFSKYKNFDFEATIVDDYPVNLADRFKKIIFNQPWNKDFKEAIRINNWLQLMEVL